MLCDEWLPRHGGISSFHRSLAIALVTAGYRIASLVLTASPAEHADAEHHGVRLITAVDTPGGPNWYVCPDKVREFAPDVVIGHDRVSGNAAWCYAKVQFPGARLVHIVHTAPAEIEPHKGNNETTRIIEQREDFTRRLAADADVVAAVGPRLTRTTQSVIDDGYGTVQVVRLDPGLTVPAAAEGRRRRVPATSSVLMLGRTNEIRLKGQDIAAKAVAVLAASSDIPTLCLRVRGAPADECDRLRAHLAGLAGAPADLISVLPFVPDRDRLDIELNQAALCVMPSTVEGFGLVAQEAIAAGTPVLVSSRSGIAELLAEQLGWSAEPLIVPVTGDVDRDAAAWADAMRRTLTDLSGAFDHAHHIRELLAPRLRWNAVVDRLAGTNRPGSAVHLG
ncbi:glycosyltransferase involved in cell wall biosynthesis [Actinocrispum wychmicini]|uniref:Glycosyltransferase involved in cell wall biosynthesis n=1 Tax=Actinocrispum wychmicini TaxID=1213861 RepID=A0A4R2JX26_9PSEU|nr:glycosyltransferase involved in cell wall biosynthesis [Actinocrispum wychmicini]